MTMYTLKEHVITTVSLYFKILFLPYRNIPVVLKQMELSLN